MKKGLCIVLSALIVTLSFSACSSKEDQLAELETKTNAEGQVYVEITDKDKKVVTGKNDKKDEKKPDGKKNDSGLEVNTSVMNNLENDDSFLDITASPKDLYDKGTSTKKTTLFQDNVQKVMKTGKFTIDMKVTSGTTKSPMKLVFDSDKMYASFEMSGMKMGLLCMNDTAYILMPNLFNAKVYMEYPDLSTDMSDMFGAFDQDSDDTTKYVGSTSVKVGSKTYICEEYKAEDGTVFKYYFDGKDWKRYECIGEDETMIYEISSFSGSADSSVFSLKGYTKVSEDMLSGLM